MERACLIRIVVADRQEMFRDGLKRLLESEPDFVVVAAASDAPQALQFVRLLDPDVLLLDLSLHGGDTLKILRALAADPHRVRTIGLTAGGGKDALSSALQHGVRGTIRKESATALLMNSIRAVFHDDQWIGPDTSAVPVDETGAGTLPGEAARVNRFQLTRREMDIVAAVAAGESNRAISRTLSLSEDTVKHHVSRVFDKLGVFSRLELAVFAFNHGLVNDTGQRQVDGTHRVQCAGQV